MKKLMTACMALAAMTFARPSLQFDRERIEMGNTFGLQLIFPMQDLPENREAPQFEAQNGFSLVKLDSADQVIRQQVDPFEDFFGGGRSRGSYKARVYTFTLKAPKKTGRINSGTIFMNINGQKVNVTGEIPVSLQRSYNDDALVVSLKPNKTTIYEGEQIYLSLNFHTYEHFAGNLQATDMSTGNDFIVHRNELSSIEWNAVEGSPRERQASAKFAWLSPTKSGNLQIPPFKFKYTKVGEPKIVEEKKQMGGMSFSSRTVKQEPVDTETASQPIKITVKPLPTEGKPADFSGMVGSYSFSANVDKSNLKVGEALTLTITMKGDGTPGTITDPKLPDFSDFRAVPPENDINKKISGQKVITTKTTRIFLYPKKKGEFTIPAISYSWFNPTKKKYETTTEGPWNIEVEKGEAPAADAIFQPQVAANPAGGPPTVQKKEIEALGSDIRFIHSIKGAADSSKAPYKEIWYWIAFLAAIPAYFAVVFTVRSKRKRNSDTALVRKSHANKQLKLRFAKAKEALSKGDAKALYAALENGLVDYLSDLTNQEYKGMTRDQMKADLQSRGVKEETIASIDSWLEKCAFARFAPVNPSANEQKQMLEDVEKLCEGLKV
ncbi:MULTISPECIES: BatD family protein [unclassified Fibrobacter]|uniref:BatD family protein n=1 Tax=unclassified Fibrobacter TaxID=2634177 RepID=UPI000D6B7F55|nr:MULTISPECIES: BatD family protein [unclassified Fibrobacter]